MSIAKLSPHETRTRLASAPGLLLDVRSPGEFASVHAAGATLLPLDQLTPAAVRRPAPGAPVYILCQGGGRAARAAEQLAAAGEGNLFVVEGGTRAWEAAGLPVERGRGTPPIERQVHMIVGPLALIGTLFGAFVHPAFLVLPALIGAGLSVAGFTGFCGLGLLLARAPWNRAAGSAAASCCAAPRKG